MSENTLDRKDLKIKALLQKINEYEERIADLRVDLTIYSQSLDNAQETIREQQDQINALSQTLEAPGEDESVQETTDSDSSE